MVSIFCHSQLSRWWVSFAGDASVLCDAGASAGRGDRVPAGPRAAAHALCAAGDGGLYRALRAPQRHCGGRGRGSRGAARLDCGLPLPFPLLGKHHHLPHGCVHPLHVIDSDHPQCTCADSHLLNCFRCLRWVQHLSRGLLLHVHALLCCEIRVAASFIIHQSLREEYSPLTGALMGEESGLSRAH